MLILTAGSFFYSSCSIIPPKLPLEPLRPHLQYFGFVLVDVGWDDPFDALPKTSYLDEVSPFCNVADLNVTHPSLSIRSNLEEFSRHQLKAVLHLSQLFFSNRGTNAPSGNAHMLRSDFQNRWNAFVDLNLLYDHRAKIQALYVGEEPTWNGISFEDLKSATDLLKSTFGEIPVMIVESANSLSNLIIPTSVDWVGFDRYFIKDPANHAGYTSEYRLLKSKRSSPSQKIVIIMDTHWIWYQHGFFGISEYDMESVANSYYKMANEDPDVVAIFGYVWPGGFGGSSVKGARNLPANVQSRYREIGSMISRK
jgi:hypothetical protein